MIEIMWEIGIEISRQRPKRLTPGLLKWADRVINIGPEVKQMHSKELLECENWATEDTADKPLDNLMQIRAGIKTRVAQLATTLSPLDL